MLSLTFLHIADLHLDSPFVGLQKLPSRLYKRLQESTFISFSKLINVAIENKVDFVVISGDLFDGEDRSLRAQSRFRKEMERLQKHHISVYLIHGNHDHLGGSWPHFEWPSNVHVFSSSNVEVKTFVKNGEVLANLYGFSYLTKAVVENKTSSYLKQEGPPFHIGLLHGSMEGENEHSRYAPFSIRDLQHKGFDYWALGHIHKRQILSENPLIVYPGNIQGRHRKEMGEKGGYLVKLSNSGVSYTFIPTAEIIWEYSQIDISQITTYDQLLDHCFKRIEELRRDQQGILLTIEFTGGSILHNQLLDKGLMDDLLAVLNEEIEDENFIYICLIKIKSQLLIDRSKLKQESHFVGDLLESIDRYQGFDEALSPLHLHSGARKFLAGFSKEELAEILTDAENYILQEIYKTKRG
ncbi:metallophosphoesterase family protein [Ferdinandcohnia quinoae]|uniref:DNA repair exonuclease n=1 Tax=Fredinandcohnia quinoae TaxID=2918902 RepID=A0AAW5E2K0_9BACI|nr:DNA repair exonuclease [Fredinandcohnia sp. SECRCQ15]MCH1627106.1 DNA repair exonuclease [Fredinandcohnia sp. SECRCQ15]